MQRQQSSLTRNDSKQNLSLINKTFTQFNIYLCTDPKAKPVYLSISQKKLTIGSKQCNQKSDVSFQINDFIGFNQQQVDSQWVRLKLNTFPKKKKIFRSLKRYLNHYFIYIKLDDNILEKVKCKLLTIATNRKFQKSNKRLKLMIYFNPNAGSNSKKHLDKTVDFLGNTNIHFDILKTERRNHCVEHINNQLKFEEYEGIVIISGDGLMHQFVNSKAVGLVPVTHVPGGSGNAFAKYQTKLADQACQTQEALYLAIKGRTKKLNLIQFNLQKIDRPVFSFLSFQWCFIADIDMNSQFLRFLGGLRFQVYAVWRLLFLRRYQGKFKYSKTTNMLPNLNEQIPNNQFKQEQKLYLHNLITFIPYISDKYQVSPLLKLQDEAMDMQTISNQQGRFSLIKYMLASQTGDHFDKQKQQKKNGYNFDWQKIKAFRLQPNGDDRGIFGIDGQQYESQKVQAKISDKKVLTFA